MKRIRFVCAAIVALLATPLLAVALAGPTTSPSDAAAPPVGREIGQTSPEIKGKDVNGKPIKLSDFKGKIVVLDFFGDW